MCVKARCFYTSKCQMFELQKRWRKSFSHVPREFLSCQFITSLHKWSWGNTKHGCTFAPRLDKGWILGTTGFGVVKCKLGFICRSSTLLLLTSHCGSQTLHLCPFFSQMEFSLPFYLFSLLPFWLCYFWRLHVCVCVGGVFTTEARVLNFALTYWVYSMWSNICSNPEKLL